MERPGTGSVRHHCTFSGCEKSFIRKEHLTRHSLSHTAAPSHICPACNRAFTRNDVLQKHIKGHAAQHEASERNKRACQPCHRAKTRCAGGLPCQSCLKRRIQCVFENHSNGSINTQTTAESERKQAGHAKDYQNAMGSASGTANIESSQYRYGSAGSIHVDTLFPGSRGNYSIVQTPQNVASRREMNSQILNVSSAIPSIQTTVGFVPNWQFAAPIAPIVATTLQPNSGYMNRVYANSINIEAGGSGELYFANFHPR